MVPPVFSRSYASAAARASARDLCTVAKIDLASVRHSYLSSPPSWVKLASRLHAGGGEVQTTVGDILNGKGTVVHSVRPNCSVFDAVRQFIEHNIGAVLVLDGSKLIGILSERDVARNTLLENKTERETCVTEIMSDTLVSASAHDTIEDCMVTMTQHRVRHLPVLDDSRVVGIVSIGDVVNAMITQKQFLIDQLEGYITGQR
jgi:CBS domain-containing protein